MSYFRNKPRNNISKIWDIKSPASTSIEQIASESGLSSLVAKVLASRGITDAAHIENLISPRLSTIRDPYLLQDMDKAADRLARAIKDKEKIIIYGDYDVDGVTATALLVRFLRWVGHDADFYIPHRLSEGYGLSKPAIRQFARQRYDLIVTVDTGISSIEEIAFANSQGIDVIVTDHHRAGGEIPNAYAVVDPTRQDCPYPFEELAGVGVAFKFVHATARMLNSSAEHAKDFLLGNLDIVALGTIADIVPLLDENRVFTRFGLERMRETENIGLQALIEVAGIAGRDFSASDVAFVLAPRINAAGRTEHAAVCVELLLTDDRIRAMEIARYLNKQNEERRRLERGITAEAVTYIEKHIDLDTEKMIVVSGEGWHTGVLGIAASKILDLYYRPAIVLAVEKGSVRGSARSIDGYSIYDALTACHDYLIAYGGHTHAAGLEVKTENLEKFRDAICTHARGNLDDEHLLPHLTIDAEVQGDELTHESVKSLETLKPFGSMHAPPVFSLSQAFLLEEPRIVGKDHLKLVLCQNGLDFDAIGFSMGHYIDEIDWTQSLDVAFRPSINTFRGRESVQLELRDIRVYQT